MMARALSSTPALWRLPFGHFSESDQAHAELRQKIIARDKNKCCECELVLHRHMEVRHLDDDHDNLKEDNLACVCPFCHLRDHLGPTGFASAGLVVGTPSLTQGQINMLALGVWYVQSRIEKNQDIRNMLDDPDSDTEEAWRQRLLSTASVIWTELTVKSTRWTGAYSPLISEPDMLGGILNELWLKAPDDYAKRGQTLSGLNILPLQEAFSTQCADWFKELDRTRPLSSWVKGLNALMGRLNTTPEDFYVDVRKSVRATQRPNPESLAKPLGKSVPAEENRAAAPIRPIGNKYE